MLKVIEFCKSGNVLKDFFIRGMENVGSVFVNLNPGFWLKIRERIASDVVPSLLNEHALA